MLEHLITADGVEDCSAVAGAHLWLSSDGAVKLVASGDVDAYLALKSRIKGALTPQIGMQCTSEAKEQAISIKARSRDLE
jgi:hypothetical protein